MKGNKHDELMMMTQTQTKPKSQSYSFHKVTYGGINGDYYTSTSTRRMTSDGTVMEESREADTTTGQATHRVSRGVHDKGHSITRKLNSDGKVDTTQMLHNLNQDEVKSFDRNWKNIARRYLPGFKGGGHNLQHSTASNSRGHIK
ncbi:myeloid leukemia factor 1-like [Impatiens glandulifera]|uniref:myeloid leukemia factor 1-like n=1 Tax=Impatiens glandulifera TaxID=253017 RepID=UPI001FB0B86B|nr:myeloid leukemia factor 1-like [Impatiens glandulifera]